MKQLSGGASKGFDPETASMEEYAAHYNRQERERNRR
jgi:hypothetical protein